MLNCDVHDYIEIICMFRYKISVTLKNNDNLTGVAQDTFIAADKTEVLKLMLDDDSERELPLEEINHIKVLTPNARFKEVNLRG